MRRDRLLARMKNNPRDDWRISEVERIAQQYGFSINRPSGGGSHVTLRHHSGEKLTVPARRPIKPVYIRQLVRMIERLEEAEA